MTVLGLTTYITLTCECGEEWTAEVCTDLGARDFVYPDEANCPDCGREAS